MRRYNLDGVEGIGGNVVAMPRAGMSPVVLACSTFVVGMITGMMLKDHAKRAYERARLARWRRDYQRTVEYDENLPELLARRKTRSSPATE